MECLPLLLAPLILIWIIIGVYYVGKRYPNYNHKLQFCSELGAQGSPTQTLSPRINNYPLGALFLLLAYNVQLTALPSIAMTIVTLMIMVHGIGTLVAGWFPMDKDPLTKQPTRACKIHSLAGFFMLLALFIAPIAALFDGNLTFGFKVFSLLTFLLMLYLHYGFVKSFKAQGNVGTMQRLAYGSQLIWLCGLGYALTT